MKSHRLYCNMEAILNNILVLRNNKYLKRYLNSIFVTHQIIYKPRQFLIQSMLNGRMSLSSVSTRSSLKIFLKWSMSDACNWPNCFLFTLYFSYKKPKFTTLQVNDKWCLSFIFLVRSCFFLLILCIDWTK